MGQTKEQETLITDGKETVVASHLQGVIKQLERQVDGLLDWGGLTPVDTTGPVFLSRIWEEHPRLFKDVVVYPSVRKMRLDCFVPCSDARDLFLPRQARDRRGKS